jgi:hypothetical protein
MGVLEKDLITGPTDPAEQIDLSSQEVDRFLDICVAKIARPVYNAFPGIPNLANFQVLFEETCASYQEGPVALWFSPLSYLDMVGLFQLTAMRAIVKVQERRG